ncbi:DeoR/GlpR family DNA-binding transcription regulator [Sphingomonas sp. DT-207]|uniref:DeoR/GlpR family DNA-binding transcription regulator n=1 Tax=Sphingomonas sp. DT-207 TaxID=3396167 RepID=UPI003F1AA03A
MLSEVPLARRDEIAARLEGGRPVNSGSLAAEFGVSEDAIRRDLRALAAAGLCRRVYGGALPLTPGMTPLADRLVSGQDRKRSLARAAKAHVEPGSFVFLDNGSTNVLVAEELPRESDLTVATSSIEIAAALAARRDIHIHMIGGEFDAAIGGSIDGTALEAVARLNIDTCFLGACALSAIGGVSAFDAADATFKRMLVTRSRRTLVLATNEKIGGHASHRIASLDAIHTIVVEHDAANAAIAELRTGGSDVLRAGPLPDPKS